MRSLSSVLLQFLALFIGGGLLVLIWVTLESYYIKRLTIAYLMEFSIPATLVILLAMVVFLMGITGHRLWRVYRGAMEAADGNQHVTNRYSQSLMRLPITLFWATVAFGGLFIPIYHIVHYIAEGHSITVVEEFYWLNFLRSFLYEQTIALIAAIFHFTVARRLIRPHLLSLTKVDDEEWQVKSFLSILTATFAGLLLVHLFSILWYVMVVIVKDHPFEPGVLLGLMALDYIFSVSMFILLTYEFRRELLILIASIRDWLSNHHSRGLNHTRMPVLSHDEVGQLAVSFNQLQAQVHQEYEELERDLQMAKQVQLQLLPAACQTIGQDRIEATVQTGQSVMNEFYDLISWERGYAAVVGASSHVGMSAALQISSALLLLRAEIDHAGQRDPDSGIAPMELLSRFNQRLAEVFPINPANAAQDAHAPEVDLSLEIAIAFVDTERSKMRTAVFGSISIDLIRDDVIVELKSGEEINWLEGDCVIMYTTLLKDAAPVKGTTLSITHLMRGMDDK